MDPRLYTEPRLSVDQGTLSERLDEHDGSGQIADETETDSSYVGKKSATVEVLVDAQSLHDLWLPEAAIQGAAHARMAKLRNARAYKRDYVTLFEGSFALRREYTETVRQIVMRGGLLRLGGTQFDAAIKATGIPS